MYPSPSYPSSSHPTNCASEHQYYSPESELANARGSWSPPTVHETDALVYPTAPSFCSLPLRFVDGQFTGKTIKTELCEIQKADLGRKYARVDRRPLDPPPVVRLTFYEKIDENTMQKVEHGELQIVGFLCTVDLFPVVDNEMPSGSHNPQYDHEKSNTTSSASPSSSYCSPTSYTSPSSIPSTSQTSPVASNNNDIVHWVGNIPITESSKITDALVGATFVQPMFIDLDRDKVLIFVFPDLAVKIQGTFLLRYRMFDLFSKVEGRDNRVIQAECYGGPFHVYSTKEFPGLQASTELTKLIARYGVRLNHRETERKRRKKNTILEDEKSSTTGSEKRKSSSMDNNDDSEPEDTYVSNYF